MLPVGQTNEVMHRLKSLPRLVHAPVANKCAAVLVPLLQDASGAVRVLLTQRSARLTTHQGEVCLPGGKRDPEDIDDIATALREANEELCLEQQDVDVLTVLPPFLSKHMLSVTPVVAHIPHTFRPTPNLDEVDCVFDMPLHHFLETELHSFKDNSWQGMEYRTHFFEYQDYKVWGLTASILIHVAKLAYSRQPAFQEVAPSGFPHHQYAFDGNSIFVKPVEGVHDTCCTLDDGRLQTADST